MAFVSSSDMISVVVSEPDVTEPPNFSRIPASAANTAAFDPNNINTLLANRVSIFFINDKIIFINDTRSLLRISVHFVILDS